MSLLLGPSSWKYPAFNPQSLFQFILNDEKGPGVAYWLRHGATSRTVPGSIPGVVTGDFFRVTPDRTMCPEVVSASESE